MIIENRNVYSKFFPVNHMNIYPIITLTVS